MHRCWLFRSETWSQSHRPTWISWRLRGNWTRPSPESEWRSRKPSRSPSWYVVTRVLFCFPILKGFPFVGDVCSCSSPVTQQKRKLRIYISNTYTPSKPEGEEAEKVSSWELRVEGKLLEEVRARLSSFGSSCSVVPARPDSQVFQSVV